MAVAILDAAGIRTDNLHDEIPNKPTHKTTRRHTKSLMSFMDGLLCKTSIEKLNDQLMLCVSE